MSFGKWIRGVGRSVDPTNKDSAWRRAGRWIDPTTRLPKTPDFTSAADQTAWGNRPNQSTPFGSTSWTQDANGHWTQNTGFSGALGDANSAWMNQANQAAHMGMPDGSAARDQAINAAYGQASSRLDPMWSQREASQKTELLNQGLDPTSQAFQGQMGQFGRDRNDAYNQAMFSAIGQGTDAGNALFNQQMQSRMLPMEQLGMMRGLLQMPGFNNGPDYLGAAGMQSGAQLGRYNAGQQAITGDIQGLASLGGAFMPRPKPGGK